MQRPTIGQLRYFLKDSIRKTINFGHTDQSRGVPAPPIQKPYETGVQLITLSDFDKITCLNEISLNQAIIKRRSQRSYKSESLSLEEISYLLYVTQGIRIKISDNVALRTVPSAGARHPFETYICATHIRDLQQGIYRYLPVEQNLYLAVQDISCGTCAVAAYDQEAMDQLLDLNTEEEFVIYLAPVGKI